MEGRVEKKDHSHISGVKCVVNTCTYHCSGDHCSASAIEIQPRNAHTTQETDCTTFAPRA
jgi:hypothetical protein